MVINLRQIAYCARESGHETVAQATKPWGGLAMHTVRNRQAQKSRKGGKPPPPRSSRDDLAFMLRQSAPAPPGFPADQIVPPHRGAVITAASWPTTAIPEPVDTPEHPRPAMSRKAARKAARRAAAVARAQNAAFRASEAQLIIAPPPAEAEPQIEAEAEPQTEHVPVLCVDVEPEPIVEPVPEIVTAPEIPLPAARALVARRQGFIDVLAFVLRDSGRRLSRWSSARRRADDLKDKLAKAEARMRAMEAQLSALKALQEHVRQSG